MPVLWDLLRADVALIPGLFGLSMSPHSLDFKARLVSHAEAVEQALARLLDDRVLPGEVARPARLMEAMRYAVLGGGKRLRPVLVLESAALCGGDRATAMRVACAVEMLHCYSLAHDDLPAMDNDDLRRGRPTLHRVFDDAMAILAGDALLTYAFDVIADEATHPDPQVRAALVLGLARASGLGGMAGGQALDLEAEGRYDQGQRQALNVAETRRLQAMKTGALIAFSAEAGAVAAQASSQMRQALLSYGHAIGAAFQIADDILDVEADAAIVGKATGKDQARGKSTLVEFLGLDAAKAERDRLVEDAKAALAPFGDQALFLKQAADFVAARQV
jgi:farnesyl diphosphate synthase